jgi:hypothetical protein
MPQCIGLLDCHAHDLNNLRDQFDKIPIVIHIQSSCFNYHYNKLPDFNS